MNQYIFRLKDNGYNSLCYTMCLCCLFYTSHQPHTLNLSLPHLPFPFGNHYWDSLVAQMVKCLPAMRETWDQSLGWEDPLEKEMATHSRTLA